MTQEFELVETEALNRLAIVNNQIGLSFRELSKRFNRGQIDEDTTRLVSNLGRIRRALAIPFIDSRGDLLEPALALLPQDKLQQMRSWIDHPSIDSATRRELLCGYGFWGGKKELEDLFGYFQRLTIVAQDSRSNEDLEEQQDVIILAIADIGGPKASQFLVDSLINPRLKSLVRYVAVHGLYEIAETTIKNKKAFDQNSLPFVDHLRDTCLKMYDKGDHAELHIWAVVRDLVDEFSPGFAKTQLFTSSQQPSSGEIFDRRSR